VNIRLGILLGMVLVMGACAMPSSVLLPPKIQESNAHPDVRDRIKERLLWMRPTQKWHYNCLFTKPVSDLLIGEQQLALPAADILNRAYWEDHRMAFRSAGHLYRQAADAGLPLAFVRLGRLLIDGKGTQKNQHGGAELMKQAAMLDCAEGQFAYADVLTKGQGVATNIMEAWAWSEMARVQGHKKGAVLQKRIESIMGPSQVGLAQENAKKLRSQLDLLNHGAEGQTLVQCKTLRGLRPFVTRMRACYAMGGTHTPY